MAHLQTPVTGQDHIQGDTNAPLTLVEYGDFQCPHCRIAHGVVKQLQKHLGTRMRFVYRNFPLLEIHPMAEPAAEAAELAAAQGPTQYWAMYDAIFAHQSRLSLESLLADAGKLGLDAAEARSAIEELRFADRIQRDLDSGEKAGGRGTPTFFINGKHYQGQWNYEELLAAMEAM